eukprot:scaffold106661_cov72-Phaeocystis_antarctica.AAC.5
MSLIGRAEELHCEGHLERGVCEGARDGVHRVIRVVTRRQGTQPFRFRVEPPFRGLLRALFGLCLGTPPAKGEESEQFVHGRGGIA